MKATRLLAYFDRISEAPDAVPRLRRFILDLAVRGKLAEQNPDDEPAAVLLKRLQAEKQRWVKDGRIRTRKTADVIEDESELYPLPFGWTWCHLSAIGAIIGGGTPPSSDSEHFTSGGSGIPWLTPADLGKHTGLYVSHGARDLTPLGIRRSSATVMPKGTVLFTSRAPIGYTAIAANDVSTNQGFKSVVPYVPECNLYIAVYFRAFGKWIDSKASGTTFREASGKIVSSLPFPLPPLAEQHRIVAKVDELMALCDRLEAAQAERERRRDRLTAASLQRLREPSEDASAFREHASFHIRHFERVTARPNQVAIFRRVTLDLAVRGKLVEQCQSDEPTLELLGRIRAHKARLINAGHARSDKQRLKLGHDALPFPIPHTWTWSQLAEIGFINPRNNADDLLSASFIPMPLIPAEYGVASRHELRPWGSIESGYTHFSDGDVGLAKITPCFENGKSTIFRDLSSGIGAGTTELHIVRPVETCAEYVLIFLKSPYFIESGIPKMTGTAGQKRVPIDYFAHSPFPLPPLAEQHRIVAKVDELMALSDQLEAQLATAQTESRRLLEALLHEALDEAA